MYNPCCQDTVVRNEDYYLYRGSTNNRHGRVEVKESRLNSLIQESNEPFRLYAKSKTQQSLTESNFNNEPYVDKPFPPNSKSIGVYQGRQVEWVRLSQLYSATEEGFYNTMDILSMKNGDSYFLASLAALIEHQPFIHNVFDEQLQISSTGCYRLRLNIRGRPRQIMIDDYLPVYKTNHQRAVFCHIEASLIWLPLLEKVYAKIHGGYDKILYGFAHEVLSTFSLAPCIYQMIPTDFRLEEQDRCWSTLMEAYQSHFPCVVGSRKEFTCEDIVPNHSYCFKQCRIITEKKGTHRFVVLWNLPQKVDRIKGKHFQEEAEGFAISIPLVEFMRNFQMIDTVHSKQNYSSYFYHFRGQPNNPQLYTFDINEKTNLYLTLHRQKGDRSVLRLILIKCTKQTSLQFISGKKEDIFVDVTLRLDKLSPGKYILICESMSESDCLLKVYTPSMVTFTKFAGNHIKLLESAFIGMALVSQKEHQMLGKTHDDWYFMRSMLPQLGMGIFMIKIDQGSEIRCEVSLNKHELQAEGLQIINKAFGNQYYRVVIGGDYDIFVFDILSSKFEVFAFPPNCLKLKMIV